MLPLTRNIFRQTATSFNNCHKAVETGKLLHPDKMVTFCPFVNYSKMYTYAHQRNNDAKVKSYCCCE